MLWSRETTWSVFVFSQRRFHFHTSQDHQTEFSFPVPRPCVRLSSSAETPASLRRSALFLWPEKNNVWMGKPKIPQRFIKKMQLENGPNGNDRKWKRWTTTLQVIVRMTWRRRGEEKGGSMRMRRRRRGSKGKISTMSSTNSRSPSVSWSYLLFTLYFCSACKTESLPDGQVQTLRCVFRSVQLLHGLEHFAQCICSRRTAGPLLFNQVRFVVGLSPQLLKPWEHKRKSRVLFCAFAGVFCFVVVQRGASVSQTWVCAWRAYTNDRQYLLARPRTPSWIPCPES